MERVKLKKLLKNIQLQAIKGPKEIEITGIASNSKSVAPGNLFIAKKGTQSSGSRFIPDAILAGAVAILTDLYDPFFPQVTQLIHSDVAAIEASLLPEFYGHPVDHLFLVGITGTNGKTTTSYLIRHLLEQKKLKCGLIGTIECIVGDHVFPSNLTTPDLLQNYKLFHEMVESKCSSCVMEVSSIGLDQGRVEGIEFDVAVFTNFTQDHLDYHHTMQSYADSKAKLFSSLKKGVKPFAKVAVVNADSPHSQEMTANCTANILGYGIDTPCALKASELRLTSLGVGFDVEYQGQVEQFTSALIGRYNVYNLLAATGVALARGLTLKEIATFLKTFTAIPGRLERIPNSKGIHVFVDYAHTDDALINVLKTLQELKGGRLITVFGCGGDRDALKRPKMGAAAEVFSDLTIITSDNPRNEDPETIIRHILAGLKNPSQALVIIDREEAIYRAIKLASADDIVLIAGKGHENTQTFCSEVVAFDDRQIARAACI